jgi:putative FmdB family regulatory protein
MPRYDYICQACGIFEHSCALQAATDPVVCPTCATEAKRVYSPPGLVKTSAVLAKRLDRAHKSAYEPEVVKRAPTSQGANPVVHGSGRPWQIGH